MLVKCSVAVVTLSGNVDRVRSCVFLDGGGHGHEGDRRQPSVSLSSSAKFQSTKKNGVERIGSGNGRSNGRIPAGRRSILVRSSRRRGHVGVDAVQLVFAGLHAVSVSKRESVSESNAETSMFDE